jgi:hypothetical protein
MDVVNPDYARCVSVDMEKACFIDEFAKLASWAGECLQKDNPDACRRE